MSNPGKSSLMINAVEFQVLESVQQALLGYAQYSAQYDLDIGKMREYGSRAACQVAQILKPGEADRFAIILSDPHGSPSVGGWRLTTLFKTNVGDVPGPEIEVWLPRPKVMRSFDEVTNFWLRNAKVQSILTGREFQKLSLRPTDPSRPDGISFSKFTGTGGGALAYPSTSGGGYETFVAYNITLGVYCGPQPLWERGGSRTAEMQFGEAKVEAAKFFYQLYGAEALEKAQLWYKKLAEKRVLDEVKLLIPKG